MRTGGLTPSEAAREAISRIVEYYPDFDGSILAASKDGTYGKNTFTEATMKFHWHHERLKLLAALVDKE